MLDMSMHSEVIDLMNENARLTAENERLRRALDVAKKDVEWIATGGAESVDGNYRAFADKALMRINHSLLCE